MSPMPTLTRGAAKPAANPTYAYAGKILRVNLATGRTWSEAWSEPDRREYLGGIGLGAKILYEEVGPKVQWDHPDNRLIFATGPLAGLPVWGTGGLTVITRGALTGGATSTQANGFFGAAIKYSGYDAIVMEGLAMMLS
jgi:aldehyde:ferredoxin oxidoreductase